MDGGLEATSHLATDGLIAPWTMYGMGGSTQVVPWATLYYQGRTLHPPRSHWSDARTVSGAQDGVSRALRSRYYAVGAAVRSRVLR